MKRNRNLQTPLAKRLRRLALTLTEAQRITRAPMGTLKHWHAGQRRTPRIVLRLLAAYRLLHWGRF